MIWRFSAGSLNIWKQIFPEKRSRRSVGIICQQIAASKLIMQQTGMGIIEYFSHLKNSCSQGNDPHAEDEFHPDFGYTWASIHSRLKNNRHDYTSSSIKAMSDPRQPANNISIFKSNVRETWARDWSKSIFMRISLLAVVYLSPLGTRPNIHFSTVIIGHACSCDVTDTRFGMLFPETEVPYSSPQLIPELMQFTRDYQNLPFHGTPSHLRLPPQHSLRMQLPELYYFL